MISARSEGASAVRDNHINERTESEIT